MDESEFDEYLEIDGVKRAQLIADAADAIDGLPILMGPGGTVEPTEQGDIARQFNFDEAEPKRPLLTPITAAHLDRVRDDVPVDVDELFRTARFYWVELPMKLYTRVGWGYNRLQVHVTFDGGDVGDRAGPTAFSILPDPEFVTYFEGKERVSLGINGRLKGRAELPPVAVGDPSGVGLEFDAGGAIEARVETKYVLGPFDYRLTAAKVKHWGHGHDEARWRLDGARYVDESDPGLRVMLRVPNHVTQLDVRVAVQARRYFATLEANFQEKIRSIPEVVANFFSNGAPIANAATFTVTADL